MQPTTQVRRAPRRSDSFDFKKILSLSIRHWWWFAVSLALFTMLIGAYVLLKPQPAILQASVLIASESKDGVSLMKQFDVSSVLGGTGSVESEVAIMSSHEVMLMTVKELQLNCKYTVKPTFYETLEPWGDTPVRLDFDHSIADTLSIPLLFKLKINENRTADISLKIKRKKIIDEKNVSLPASFDTPFGKFTFTPADTYAGMFDKHSSVKLDVLLTNYSNTAELYQKTVMIAAHSRKVSLVNLSYSTLNPQHGIEVIESVIRNYNILGIANERQKGERTIAFIDQRLMDMSHNLDSKEADIEHYASTKGVGNVEADAVHTMERSIKLQESLIKAESEYKIMQLVKSFLSDPENRYALIPSVGEGISQSVESGILAYNDQIIHRMNLLKHASEDNIVVKNLDDNINAMRNNIDTSLDKAMETATTRLAQLRAQTSAARGKELSLPETQREFLVLKRDQGIQEKLYLYLLQQREEKALKVANINPSAEIIDNVYVRTTENGPSLKVYALMILFFGFGIPFALIVIKDRLRSTVDSADEVKNFTSLPILAKINAENLAGHDRSWARAIQANLGYMLGASGGNTVMVTSFGHGEGKKAVAAAIATEFAAQGLTTALLDADFAGAEPSVFGISPQAGIADYIAGNATLQEISVKVDSEQSLTVIPATAEVSVADASGLIASPRFRELLSAIARDYRVVIVNAPVIGAEGTDTSIIAAQCDATLMVTREGVSRISDLERFSSLNASGIYRSPAAVFATTA